MNLLDTLKTLFIDGDFYKWLVAELSGPNIYIWSIILTCSLAAGLRLSKNWIIEKLSNEREKIYLHDLRVFTRIMDSRIENELNNFAEDLRAIQGYWGLRLQRVIDFKNQIGDVDSQFILKPLRKAAAELQHRLEIYINFLDLCYTWGENDNKSIDDVYYVPNTDGYAVYQHISDIEMGSMGRKMIAQESIDLSGDIAVAYSNFRELVRVHLKQ